MQDNYARLVRHNLEQLYRRPNPDLETGLPARREDDRFIFRAFGQTCRLQPDGIYLDDRPETGVLGILVSLYALWAQPAPLVLEPFKGFKDLPGSMPYVGAFSGHTEKILVPAVPRIQSARRKIIEALDGHDAQALSGGDFSLLVTPLPKICLCYVFYEADEDFAASATCLFSSNATVFMPIDGLADVGEYTSQKILTLAGSAP